MSKTENEAKFKIDEIVALRQIDWGIAWQTYIKTRIDEQSLKRDSNNNLQSKLKEFYDKTNHKIIGIRRKVDFVDSRDRYNRKIVDGYEYLLEKKVLVSTNDEWIDEDLICPVSDKLQEMMIFSNFLNEGVKKFIEEINGPTVEKKVVDIEDDIEIELEL